MITREGVGLAAAAVVLGVAGLLLRFPELIALALVGVLALLVAAGWLALSPDVTIAREITPERVTEGDGARGIITVTNAARRRCPPIIASERVAGRVVRVALPSLAPGSRFEASYPLPTDRRGVFEVGPLTLGHSDPLRLMYVGRSFQTRSVLRVHPRVHTVAALPTRGSADMDGPTSSAAPAGGVAFHSLREYVRGDDLRLVHWRSSARTGTLMVRHHVVPNEPRMLVVLDTSAEPYLGGPGGGESFEDAVRVAASLAVSACIRGHPVEVCTTAGERAGTGRGRTSPGPILDLCAAARPAPGDPGLAALPGLVPDADGVSLGVVTGAAAATRHGVVATVRPRFSMVSLVRVGAEPGRPAPPVPGVLVVSVGSSDEFVASWNTAVRR